MGKSTVPRIGPGTSVRDILTRYPSAEAIFERHGLLGCGGPNGPREPIGFFARVHRVDPKVLLEELNEHVARASAAPRSVPAAPPAPAVYPIFLVTSLAIAILAGFTTGIVALASGALGWVIPGVDWLALVQLHGRLQLYGWAGLFVFGVAYHIVPRFVAAPLAWPRLAKSSYALVVLGLLLSAVQLATTGDRRILQMLFTVGLLLLVAATACYSAVIVKTVLTSEQPPELPIVFIVTGGIWLILGTVVLVVVGVVRPVGQTLASSAEEPALQAVLEGFLVVTALGVSLRTLPVFAGLATTREKLLRPAFLIVQLGLAGLVGGAALSGDLDQATIGRSIAALGSLLLFAGIALYLWAIRLFEPASLPVVEMGTGRGWARAIRFAYGWLLIGTALQGEASVRSALASTAIPWGTLAAARHAIALGFVTLLIVGMASRVIPVFAGKPLWKPWLVDVATGGLVASAGLRVPIETLVPYGSAPLTDLLLAASGPLALAGLIAFALNFTVTMVRRDRPEGASSGPGSAATTEPPRRPLRPDDLLADALRVPGGLQLLLGLGLSYLADPGHRAIAARSLSIAQAARRADRDPDQVLAVINRSWRPAEPATAGIDPDRTVADVLASWPATLDVFLRHGFTPLADPRLREQLSATITVRQAAAARGVDLERLLADLRAVADS